MFKFLDIELIGFTGMVLNNVHRFKLTFDSPYTLLLGRNGSGKSRLIAMLNPLPPNKEDFLEDGSKRIRIQFNGEVFNILTVFEKSLKSTIINETTGETIIEHANPTVHANTVRQLFNWTKELNDVITGQVLFTKMSVAERKKWFGLLSESDLTYALKFFKTAKDRARDLEGVRRHLKRSVEDLAPRVIEQTELLELARQAFNNTTKDIDEINKVIQDTNAAKPFKHARKQEVVEGDILRVSDAILKSQYTYTEEDLSEQLYVLEARISDLLAQQKELSEDYVQLQDKSKTFEQFNPEGLDAIKRHIAEYESILADLNNVHVEWDLSGEDIATLAAGQKAIPNVVAKLIEWLPDYRNVLAEKAPLQTLFEDYTQQIETLTCRHREANNRIQDIQSYLTRAEQETSINCPKCTHGFKPGYTDTQVTLAHENLVTTHNTLDTVTLALGNSRKGAERVGGLITSKERINSVMSMVHSHPVFKPLFAYYLNSSDAFNVEAVLKSFVEDLDTFHDRALYKQRLETAKARYERGLAVISGDALKLQVLKDKTMSQMDVVAERLSLLKEQHTGINVNHVHLKRLEDQLRRLDNLGLEHADSIYHDYLCVKESECIGYRDILMGRLAESRQRLMRMDQEAKELARLTAELNKVEDSLVSTKSIVKAISPEEGVLSEYLHRSMVGITDLMTAYINSVWSYEMCIKPCDFSSGDLDYKFPFWDMNESNLKKDISRGSKAQQEVFNFVFVLAVYRAMGLDGYPLLLDEISSGFDEEHKPTMVDYVKRLVDTEQHMQLVMVSHDATTHYRLTHADLCVLDPVGVTLPESYNVNVIME